MPADGVKAQSQNNRNRRTKPKNCPECGSVRVLRIVHGNPTPAQAKALAQGKAVLGKREEWEGVTEWYCNACGCDWSGEWRRYRRAETL